MHHHANGYFARMADAALARVSALPPRLAGPALVVTFAISVWVIAVAPPVLSLALAVFMALAWCARGETGPKNDEGAR